VSHYNYYRNFEGLFRAVAILRQSLSGRKFKLFLTCRLHNDENPGSYRTQAASRLIDHLSIRNEVVELGAIPYRRLHNVYRACDIYVTPAYTETFAHPLVEAMASGLPIVASDLPVHREICGDAAMFGSSGEGLARCLHDLSCDEAARQTLATNGKRRAADFSWVRHTQALLNIAAQLRERADPLETAGLPPLVSHEADNRFGTISAVQVR
jgi:glycosyltransferase involved in cell wall biosynthesis